MSLSRIGSSSLCVLLLALACGGKSEDPEPGTSDSQLDAGKEQTSEDEASDEEDAGPEETASEPDAGVDASTGSDEETETASDEATDDETAEDEATDSLEAGATAIVDGGSPTLAPEASIPQPEGDSGLPSLPEECQSTGYAGEGYCSLTTQCAALGYTYSNCSQSGDHWLCSCSGPNNYGNFEMSGTGASAACETAAALCLDGFQPSFDGPMECQEPSFSAGDEYCYASLPCSRRVDLGNGVVSVENHYRETNCSANPETGSWSCGCYDSLGNNSNVVLDGVGDLEACQVSLDLCTSGEEPVPVGEPVCGEYTTNADASYCQTMRECVQEVTIGDATVGQATSDGSYCSSKADGGWDCYCQGSNPSRIRVEVPASAEPEASCEQAADVCVRAVGADLTGEIECAIKGQSSYGEINCSAELECTRDIALEGAAAQGYTNVSVYCGAYGEEWSCNCSDDDENQTFTLPTGESAWNTCTNAASECVGLLTLTPGEPYSSSPRPPLPLPIPVDPVGDGSSTPAPDQR